VEEYDARMRADEPKKRAAGSIDVSADVYAKEDAPPVAVPPADHVLSYVDRASSSFAAATAVESLEPSSSSAGIRPLALALLLGVAIGFAGGYGMGYQVRPEEEAATIDELAVSSGSSGPALLAMTADPPRPARREFTEEQVKSPPVSDAIAGRIVVRSTPAGARVVVNGRDVGQTPITMNNLSRGSHDVRIERDGYGAVERHVVVTDSQPESQLMVALARELPAPPPPAPIRPSTKASGSLGVDSRPGGARVFVDGKLAGATPLSLDALAPGEYAVRLEREGYRQWASIVRVVAGESHRVAASLEADAQTPPRR
jgi:hypothetical protein